MIVLKDIKNKQLYRAVLERFCVCVCVCVCARLQVGCLNDRLLIDCLSLHNRRKGYLSVSNRIGENEHFFMSTMDERLSFTHTVSANLTPPFEVIAVMSQRNQKD